MAVPDVSVVVPVKDGERFLEIAVRSVLAQTHADLEVLIVDDGSMDASAAIGARLAFDDPRVRLISKPNGGLSSARNAGVREAGGRLIAFLDADDVWEPQKLERQISLLDADPSLIGTCTQFEEIDESGALVNPWERLADRYPTEVSASDLIQRGNTVAGSGSAVLVRADALRVAGPFDERLPAAEDLDLWYRLATYGRLRMVPEVLVQVRRHAAAMQNDWGRVLLGRAMFLHAVRVTGSGCDRAMARSWERKIRLRLVRYAIRNGRLGVAAGQVVALAFGERRR